MDDAASGQVVLARREPFTLGPLEIRPALKEVAGPEGVQRLEPRVMQVLVALADAGGAPVSRDDLVVRCWGGRVVGDDAINRTIGLVRRTLETCGGRGLQVETINKVGYRLLGQGMIAADVGEGEEPAPSVPTMPERRMSRRAVIAGGGSALAVASAGGWWLISRRGAALSPEATALLDRGVLASRLGTAESTAEAVGLLQELVEAAPGSARAWAALAIACQDTRHFRDEAESRAFDQRSRSAAERALAIDPGNAEAHAALALAIAPYRNWAASEVALRAVLVRDPNQFETRRSLTRVLANVGRTREAAVMLAPLATPNALQPMPVWFLAFLYWQAGRIVESDQLLERAAARWPRNYQIWFTRFWQRTHSGRPREALAMLADTANRPVGIPDWNFDLIRASAQALQSRTAADIEAAVSANRAAAHRGAGHAENAIEMLSALNRVDEALAIAEGYFLGRGFRVGATRYSPQQGSYTLPARRETKLLFSPTTEPLRRHPGYARLVQDIGLETYWRSRGTRPDT